MKKKIITFWQRLQQNEQPDQHPTDRTILRFLSKLEVYEVVVSSGLQSVSSISCFWFVIERYFVFVFWNDLVLVIWDVEYPRSTITTVTCFNGIVSIKSIAHLPWNSSVQRSCQFATPFNVWPLWFIPIFIFNLQENNGTAIGSKIRTH